MECKAKCPRCSKLVHLQNSLPCICPYCETDLSGMALKWVEVGPSYETNISDHILNPSKEYLKLANVLDMAYNQAANGKGKERHASDKEAFEDQPICEITRRVGMGYPLGQSMKKTQESLRFEEPQRRIAELLGAINYLAAAVIIEMENDIGYDPDTP